MIPTFAIDKTQYETYLVEYNGHVWEMSRDADMPNGVFIYLGEAKDQKYPVINQDIDIPKGIVRALMFLHGENISINKSGQSSRKSFS